MVMNTQLVRIVIMMNMLNSVGGGGSRKGREQVGREVLPGQSTPFGLSPNPSPAFSQPGARPTLAGYEWMSTLMALRLTTLKGLST